ncbi:hypothetical protein COCMIDRAFT_108591, partial [Bipolaris oryzae ATCC 44560]
FFSRRIDLIRYIANGWKKKSKNGISCDPRLSMSARSSCNGSRRRQARRLRKGVRRAVISASTGAMNSAA